ncbi:MAG: bifunctional glutamate N-acetyltransferase/amino-acid acetyltransferase ArgJ [Candidatus Omnitrophota bacterium]
MAQKTFEKIRGGVTTPCGFRANGLSCGIKRSGKTDLSLIVSDVPAAAAAVFTRNSVKAAPLLVSRKHLRDQTAQAIMTNSGNANCMTGDFGLVYARQMAEGTAACLGIRTQDVIVASTGIIGQPLPYARIAEKTPDLVRGIGASRVKARRAAEAIMTTDTRLKESAVRLTLGGKTVHIAGCAKGSGMIEPNMATMLGYITTDAAIDPLLLKQSLREAVDMSFNCITVDGCMSTNDMVTVMANAQAGNRKMTRTGPHFRLFTTALREVCLDLAKQIVRDGEGAKTFMEITVKGAVSIRAARKAAKAIANSNLVKTAHYGPRPNWGRIAAAVGSLDMGITPEILKIDLTRVKKNEIILTVDIGFGDYAATVYTCDLTADYVRINGEYN